MTSAVPATSGRVFLSYAYDDHALAQRISDALARSGIRSTNQVWEVSPGEHLTAWLRETIRASDVVLVLVSPAVAGSRWVDSDIEFALSRDLDRCGAEVIPVLVAPTELPPALRDRAMVDLTEDVNAGLQQLVEQIRAISRADFSTLSPRRFEDLVGDLLRAAGFGIDKVRHQPDAGVDLHATYQHDDRAMPRSRRAGHR